MSGPTPKATRPWSTAPADDVSPRPITPYGFGMLVGAAFGLIDILANAGVVFSSPASPVVRALGVTPSPGCCCACAGPVRSPHEQRRRRQRVGAVDRRSGGAAGAFAAGRSCRHAAAAVPTGGAETASRGRRLHTRLPPVPARCYRPHGERLPLVVYAHGGGFVAGGLDSHDRTCRRLAIEADAAVLAVDYRLAPEHLAPAAVDDLVTVTRWASAGPDQLGPLIGAPALAGDTIAMLAAQQLLAMGTRISGLLLVCPIADLTFVQPSVLGKGTGWGLDHVALTWFVQHWVPVLDEESLRSWSPLHTDMSGLPPTLVATAEHDSLRDSGTALVERLVDHGVVAELLPHAGLVHGFLGLDDVSPAAAEAGTVLMRRLGTPLHR